MSSQTRIDQYFKCTSINKVTNCGVKPEKGSNRLKPERSLTRLKNGPRISAKSPAAASSEKKKPWVRWNSEESSWPPAVKTPERLPRSSLPSSSINSQSRNGKYFADAESAEIQIIDAGNITPTKKTIKSFAKACNSPPLNPSPGKLSLKRRNKNIPASRSPPKKSLTYDENCTIDSQPDVIEISAISSSLSSAESSIFEDDFPENFDPDIVELNTERSSENFSKKLSEKFRGDISNGVEESVTPEKRRFEGAERGIENAEESTQAKRNKLDDGTASTRKKKIAPKKDKNASSCGNSPSTSPWKVAVTIKTPDRTMTALSSDWQKTLEVSKKQSQPSISDKNMTTKENFEASMTESGGNDENLSNQITINSEMNHPTKKRENNVNVSLTKYSPRRALFSLANSPKKVCFETKDCASSLSEVKAEADITKLTNGSTNSPVTILGSANLRINGQLNSPSKKDESISSPTIRHDVIGAPIKRKLFSESCISPTKNNVSSNLSPKKNEYINSPTNKEETIGSPTKMNGSSILPTKINGSSISPTKINESSILPTKINGSSSTPTKIDGSSNLPVKSTTFQTPSRSSNASQFPPNPNAILATPTKSPTKSHKSSFSPRVKYSPQKMRKELVDRDIAIRVVENLNQAKQGVIPLNDFDLEAIYAKKSFELEYGNLITNTAIKYEADDVQVPKDKHADHLFMVLANVFSEPMNCGYFDEKDLDMVFSILTLSPKAQSLLARMLKRRRGWHRVNTIQYSDISADLKPVFKELVEHGFLDGDIENEEMSISLKLLQIDEIKAVCRSMNVKHTGRKPMLIDDLVKLSRKHSLFSTIKSPSSVLKGKIISVLESCVRLPERVESLLNRIFILLIPTQDPKETIVDAFYMLLQVHKAEKIFPPTPNERFPIFRDRLHLIRYAEARAAWTQIIKASENKEWDKVRELGQLAYDRLEPYFESNDSGDESDMPTLPSHVKRFDDNYAWTKVLSTSVDAYKKSKDFDVAVKFLEALISERNKMPGNRIRWYGELALIEMSHRKDLETSANLTINALNRDRLSEIDAAEMMDRAKKLLKRRKGISPATKQRINEVVRLRQEMFISTSEPMVTEIEARVVQGNVTGSKSTWSVAIGNDVGYMSVEQVALRHYFDKGFTGMHCEGALPVTLFATLFWNEIYDISVPGAFVSPYQDAPLDLYTSRFIDNRRESVEMKLDNIRKLDLQCVSQMMHEDFVKYRHYQSLMHGNLFHNVDDFEDFINCLGIDGVVGICGRLAGNYNQWKSGFPDLVLWDSATKKCKIVEVKGPGDSLSTKQRLWIQFLESIGIAVEVCVVKGTTKRYA